MKKDKAVIEAQQNIINNRNMSNNVIIYTSIIQFYIILNGRWM